MDIARTVIRNNRTTLILYVLVMITGINTFFSIGRLEYPEFTIRVAQVITVYPGRTSVQVEEEVTDPLEQAIRQMSEVEKIESTSKPGLSILTVTLEGHYYDLQPIWQKMRNRIAETDLPDGSQTPFVYDDFGDVFPYVFALRGDGYTPQELLDAGEDIQDELLKIPGVDQVRFHGEQPEKLFMEFNPAEIAAYGISPNLVINQVRSQNQVQSSGQVDVGNERVSLLTTGEFESQADLADYRLAIPGQSTSLRISDLMDLERGYADPPSDLAHYNSERVLCIAISMKQGEVVTEVGAEVKAQLDRLQSDLPWGLDIETMFYQPEYVNLSIRNFVINLGQSFFFVLLVMFLFAGGRIAVIVGVLVPSAVLSTFALMPLAGVQLEMMSIAALIIALGLLVDNAVVVSEQVLVRLSRGENRLTAVSDTVKNLAVPLLAASGTTIAAFSPVALAEGDVSEFTYSLFAVVSLTLLSSWVLSLTVIPLLCYAFLKPLKHDTFVGRGFNKLVPFYKKTLKTTLSMGWGYPIIILVCTVLAGMAFRFVPNIFFPPNERSQFIVDVELPLGTGILHTEEVVKHLETWMLQEQPEVKSVSSWIGSGGPRWYLSLSPEPANPNYSLLTVITHSGDPAVVRSLVDNVNRYAKIQLPQARVTAKVLENGPPVGDPIQVKLFGEDMDTLYRLRDQIMSEMSEITGMYDIRDSWGAWTKQLRIETDSIRMARLGLTSSAVAQSVQLQVQGRTITQLREGEEVTPVVMRSQDSFREAPERLQDLPVFGSSQGTVPLGAVANVDLEFLPGSVVRENNQRVMTVKSRVRGRYASEALAELKPRLDERLSSPEWPEGYRIEYAGEEAESSEAQGQISGAMPISMTLLAMILISQFNSIRRFGIILLTIPPMLIGVVPGLVITGSSFGFMTLLGMIALLGIIVNNAILLIDEINSNLTSETDLRDAIIAACESRLRPIVMTTLTTVISLSPLAISGGGMWSSMAYAMMFGLSFATLLTLLLCPVLFYQMFKGAKGD